MYTAMCSMEAFNLGAFIEYGLYIRLLLELCVFANGEMGCICMCDMNRWEHSVAWLQREAVVLLSFLFFPLTHYPGGSVMAPQSGLLLLLINLKER